MVLTVTLNPAIDKTVYVPTLQVGGLHRLHLLATEAGGKGINVAKALRQFFVPYEIVGFLGEDNEAQYRSLLAQQGLTEHLIGVSGSNRINLKVKTDTKGEVTELNESGFCVSEDDLARMTEKIKSALCRADMLVLSGSLPCGCPADYYARLCRLGRKKGVPVAVDADGEALLAAAEEKPYMVKPNEQELSRLVGRPLCTVEELAEAGAMLCRKGVHSVLVSRGEKGAILVNQDGMISAGVPKATVKSPIAAGDTMVAAFIYAMKQGFGKEALLRFCVAAGTATASKEGSQVCTKEEAHLLFEQTEIQEKKG